MDSIMSQLPHDLIMNIIRESDGGRYSHKIKYKTCMAELNKIRDFFHKNLLEEGTESYYHDEEIIKFTTMSDRDYSFLEILGEEDCMLQYYGSEYEKTCFHYQWQRYEYWAKPEYKAVFGACSHFKQEWL